MLQLDFDDTVLRELRGYVLLVSQAMGLRGESSCVDDDEPSAAYIALDGRLGDFPDHDVALLWDEYQGWSAAIESRDDLHAVAHFGWDPMPPPDAVAAWAHGLLADPAGRRGRTRHMRSA